METQVQEIMRNARAFGEKFLPECCEEILEWHDTGLLRNGWFRQLGAILQPMDYHYLGIAESLINELAMRKVLEVHNAGK